MSLGSPFQSGSRSYLLLAVSATVVMAIFYLRDADRLASPYLLFVCIGLAGSVRAYFKYRSLKDQGGRELLEHR